MSNKGTIIYIGGFEMPDKNAAAHRVLSNAKIFRELQYNVVFISVDKELKYKNNILNTKKKVQGFDCWSVPYPKSKKQWIDYLCNIKSFLIIAGIYADVKAVICYNYQAIALMKIKKYCNKEHIKVIADSTEWYSTKGSNVPFKIIKGLDSFLRMRIIQRRLDGLIVISRYLEKYYSKYNNVICIPPLVDYSEEKWITQVPQNKDDIIRFVYAGNPGKNKDKLNIIINCLYKLNKISNFVFNVIGITKEQYIQDYKEQKKIIEKLSDKAIFRGHLSHLESLQYIKAADFCLFIRENSKLTKAGFPTKFVESISCGTPIITTRTSDLEDYIVEGENGFFLDLENIEYAVLKLQKVLLMSADEVYKMKKICLESKLFNFKKYTQLMRKFLTQINN